MFDSHCRKEKKQGVLSSLHSSLFHFPRLSAAGEKENVFKISSFYFSLNALGKDGKVRQQAPPALGTTSVFRALATFDAAGEKNVGRAEILPRPYLFSRVFK